MNPISNHKLHNYSSYAALSAGQMPFATDKPFYPAKEQTAVIPPPITVNRAQPIYLPIEPIVLAAGAGIFFWRRERGSDRLRGQ